MLDIFVKHLHLSFEALQSVLQDEFNLILCQLDLLDDQPGQICAFIVQLLFRQLVLEDESEFFCLHSILMFR